MKAIILAAGVGNRLRETLAGRPKCMLEFGGRTLVQRLLASLGKAGVGEAVIVVGHRRELIQEAIGNQCAGVRVRYIVNPEYEKGAILSLWAARDEFIDDLLVMDADVLCPDALIARLVRSEHASCFLLDGRVDSGGEEMMLMARNGRVLNIARTVEPGYDTVGESVGFLKVARAAAPGLLAALQGCVEAGRDRIEHEDAYPIFLQQYVVGYERVDDLPWTEIDFAEDITRAERELLPLIDGEKSSDE